MTVIEPLIAYFRAIPRSKSSGPKYKWKFSKNKIQSGFVRSFQFFFVFLILSVCTFSSSRIENYVAGQRIGAPNDCQRTANALHSGRYIFPRHIIKLYTQRLAGSSYEPRVQQRQNGMGQKERERTKNGTQATSSSTCRMQKRSRRIHNFILFFPFLFSFHILIYFVNRLACVLFKLVERKRRRRKCVYIRHIHVLYRRVPSFYPNAIGNMRARHSMVGEEV